MKRSILSLLLLAVACGGGKTAVDLTKPLDTKDASNAARAYQRGLEEKQDQNVPEATRYFEAVRNNFPYSQYAALAEIALDDMLYEQDNWVAAATAYQEFVKSHPSHPKADYAAFRAGLAHYNDKAGDFFLFPPSFERDQTPVRQALDAFQKFVAQYPKSQYAVRAKDLINDCRERLAAHDRYVVGFYWKRKAWRGAAGRLLDLADTYGDLQGGKLKGDSLWRAAVAYYNVGDPAAERDVLQRLVQESPGDPHAKEAAALLQRLPQKAPEPESKGPAEPPPTPPQRPEAAPHPGEPPGPASQPPNPDKP